MCGIRPWLLSFDWFSLLKLHIISKLKEEVYLQYELCGPSPHTGSNIDI